MLRTIEVTLDDVTWLFMAEGDVYVAVRIADKGVFPGEHHWTMDVGEWYDNLNTWFEHE